MAIRSCLPVPALSVERIQFLLNLIVYKAEFFLRASTGRGIDDISPGLVQGPVPVGATLAVLDNDTRRIIEELGLTSVGHMRAISEFTQLNAPIPRPVLNLSAEVFTAFANAALNVSTLTPPFNVYASTTNFLVAATFVSSLLQQYYAGLIPSTVGSVQQRLVAGIALSEAAGYGVLRAQLYPRVNQTVSPYTFTLGRLFNLITELINRLGGCGVKDEGLTVPLQLGAENQTTSNVVPADVNSLAYPRTERELLRIVFGTGNATRPGAIFPAGFNGTLFRRIVLQRLA
ncbi:hypothetical protein like AT3G62730 [Hibiscus trionum]|uniref:Desiccation-related protein PCC13-62 n=1 Tax=Hibiscus trionum TaxID=183268 RepID=A0A9W7IN76_HIBTR|nr:hypothetical protein like AT3G62730 [Hibiscus trionum]